MQFSFISFHKRKLDQYLGDVKANVLRRLVISVNSQPSAPATTLLTQLPLPLTACVMRLGIIHLQEMISCVGVSE